MTINCNNFGDLAENSENRPVYGQIGQKLIILGKAQ